MTMTRCFRSISAFDAQLLTLCTLIAITMLHSRSTSIVDVIIIDIIDTVADVGYCLAQWLLSEPSTFFAYQIFICNGWSSF
jgi:hypothetical protein